jgi:outer membrane PBP1 activator LpoA protein
MKSMRLSLLCAAVALIGGCGSTPLPPDTSLPVPIINATVPPSMQALPKPPPEPTPPPAEAFAIDLPGGVSPSEGERRRDPAPADDSAPAAVRAAGDNAPPSNAPIRIGLLLPLQSETLGAAASSLRAGFMAGWERDRDNITVTVIETGDVPQDVLASYARALQSEDIIVGPLSRSAVATVAASPLISKPTIALNYPEGYGLPNAAPLPPQMLAMGLSIEEEARQAAQWAAADHPNSSALILTTSTPWQRRVAAAFAAQWQRLGQPVRMVELSAPDGYLSDPELVQLRSRLRDDLPGLLFSAMGADQTRQLRGALSSAMTTEPTNPIFSTADAMPPPTPAPTENFSSLPIYGTSALNPGGGNSFASQDMDGVRLLDLPWQVQRDHPAVMVYPHPLQSGMADMERLYALGIDAFRVAREIGRQRAGRFQLDGVTGKLTVDFGNGPASFERVELPAAYKNGVPQPVGP